MNHADYVISTAHKAKGLEWSRVQLDDDFYYDVTTHGVDLVSGLKSGKKLVYG